MAFEVFLTAGHSGRIFSQAQAFVITTIMIRSYDSMAIEASLIVHVPAQWTGLPKNTPQRPLLP
jgi:hypothetical protein